MNRSAIDAVALSPHTYLGSCLNLHSDPTAKCLEIPADVKGDIARTVLYMEMRYLDYIPPNPKQQEQQGQLQVRSTPSSSPSVSDYDYDHPDSEGLSGESDSPDPQAGVWTRLDQMKQVGSEHLQHLKLIFWKFISNSPSSSSSSSSSDSFHSSSNNSAPMLQAHENSSHPSHPSHPSHSTQARQLQQHRRHPEQVEAADNSLSDRVDGVARVDEDAETHGSRGSRGSSSDPIYEPYQQRVGLKQWRREDLIEWHYSDPVSRDERHRVCGFYNSLSLYIYMSHVYYIYIISS